MTQAQQACWPTSAACCVAIWAARIRRLELFGLQHTASKRDLEAIGTEPPLYAQTYKTNNLPGDFTELLHAFLAEANVGLVELAAGCSP